MFECQQHMANTSQLWFGTNHEHRHQWILQSSLSARIYKPEYSSYWTRTLFKLHSCPIDTWPFEGSTVTNHECIKSSLEIYTVSFNFSELFQMNKGMSSFSQVCLKYGTWHDTSKSLGHISTWYWVSEGGDIVFILHFNICHIAGRSTRTFCVKYYLL